MQVDRISNLIEAIQKRSVLLYVNLPPNLQSILYQNPPVITCFTDSLEIVEYDTNSKDLNLFDYLPKVDAYLVNKKSNKKIPLFKVLEQLSEQQKEILLQSIIAEFPKEWFLLLNWLGLQAAKSLNLNLSQQRLLLTKTIPPTVNLVNINQN